MPEKLKVALNLIYSKYIPILAAKINPSKT